MSKTKATIINYKALLTILTVAYNSPLISDRFLKIKNKDLHWRKQDIGFKYKKKIGPKLEVSLYPAPAEVEEDA